MFSTSLICWNEKCFRVSRVSWTRLTRASWTKRVLADAILWVTMGTKPARQIFVLSETNSPLDWKFCGEFYSADQRIFLLGRLAWNAGMIWTRRTRIDTGRIRYGVFAFFRTISNKGLGCLISLCYFFRGIIISKIIILILIRKLAATRNTLQRSNGCTRD